MHLTPNKVLHPVAWRVTGVRADSYRNGYTGGDRAGEAGPGGTLVLVAGRAEAAVGLRADIAEGNGLSDFFGKIQKAHEKACCVRFAPTQHVIRHDSVQTRPQEADCVVMSHHEVSPTWHGVD